MTVQHPASVNLIIGSEDFLVERHRKAIVAAARLAASNPDLPVEDSKISDISEGEFIELLSPSLFAEDRIILITGLEEASKDMAALIAQHAAQQIPGVVLILTHTGKGRNKNLIKDLPAAGAKVFLAEELKGRAKVRFIEEEFRRRKIHVTPDVVEALQEGVGSDVRSLASAIDQLIADTNAQVTASAVRRYYSGKAEMSGFDVAEYALTGRKEEAIVAMRQALQVGVPHVLLASALSGMVGDIATVRGVGRVDSRRQAADFGMPPWKLEKTARIARGWSAAAVARGVQIVADLDTGVKGGAADPDYALEMAVHSLADLVRK